MAPVVLVMVVVVGAVKVRCASSQQTHFMSKSSSVGPAASTQAARAGTNPRLADPGLHWGKLV